MSNDEHSATGNKYCPPKVCRIKDLATGDGACGNGSGGESTLSYCDPNGSSASKQCYENGMGAQGYCKFGSLYL